MAATVEAQVKLIKTKATSLGQRTYVVFTTVDGRDVGIWAPADHQQLLQLQEGDQVYLRRDARGHYHLPSRFRAKASTQ